MDALTGPLIGLPKSASFRLLDIVGLDVWVHVLRNLYEAAPHDPARERLRRAPDHAADDGARLAGRKARPGLLQARGQGREKQIHALDRKTLEYHPAQKVKFRIGGSGARHRRPAASACARWWRAAIAPAQFLWQLFRDFVLYSARMVPEISDRIVEIDRAMRWGYAFALGPFELWDALGVPETVERMRAEGCAIPANVERMLAAGAQSLLSGMPIGSASRARVTSISTADAITALEPRPGVLVLADIKRARGVVKRTTRAPRWWIWATACSAWNSTAR